MTLGRPLVLAVALAGCSVPDVDYTGKQCPCPSGYTCNAATSTCSRSALANDARGPDGTRGGSDGATDAAPAASCLAQPFALEIYSTATFADFTTAWSTSGGDWKLGTGELDQLDTTAQLSVAYLVGNGTDFRIVGTMHATSGGNGKAIELTLRVDAANTHMYHCNWEPADGAFLIQRTDSVAAGMAIQTITIDTSSIPGYQETDPVTMEFQVSGSQFSCCLHGIPAAYIQGSDTTYAAGAVGVKTYEMSGGFSDFFMYSP